MSRKIELERLGLYLKLALEILNENDGQMASRDVTREVGARLDLSEEELEPIPSGSARWENAFHWYSVNAVKAGWIRKKGGVWYLTPEGSKASELSPREVIGRARKAYRDWKRARQDDMPVSDDDDLLESGIDDAGRDATFDRAEGWARDQIRRFLRSQDPYAFQDIVAAMLRGMGYHTPFIAPKGRDGGVDIRAYQDPLGTREPRIIVQVKHRKDTKVSSQEVRELVGILRDGEIGLFVSTGGFTSDAVAEMQRANRHVESVDLDALIDLWQEYYEKLEEDDKALLPLRRVWFLAPDE